MQRIIHIVTLLFTVFGCQQCLAQQRLLINYSNGGELNTAFQRKLLSELPEDALMISGDVIELLEDGIEYRLVADATASYYSLNMDFAERYATQNTGKKNVITLDTLSSTFYDYHKKTIVYDVSSKLKPRVVRESGFRHEYEPTGETVSVLGYTCVAIAVQFCGHPYTVYYTPEIPYPTGPSYFVGFPGLVLKAVSKVSGRGYVAKSVDIVEDFDHAKNTIIPSLSTYNQTENFSSFKEYCSSR